MTGPPSGRHLGRKLADIMHESRVAAASKIIPGELSARADYHRSFMESVEQDLAPMFRTIFQTAVDDPATPVEAKAFLRPLVQPEHQGQFFLTLLAVLGLAFEAPGAAAAGWIADLRAVAFTRTPAVPLTPDQMAEAVLKGAADEREAVGEALKSGVNQSRLEMLVKLTGDPPGPQELMEALRRGYIDEARFEHGIRQGRIKNEWIDVLNALRYAPPSAGLAIAAAVQNHLSRDEAVKKVSEAGIDPANYQWLYDTHGRPPGTVEMIQLLRRGKATSDEVAQAIRESDVKDKYIPAILELAHVTPPQRTVVSGLRQGAVDEAQARTWLGHLGLDGPAQDMLIREAHNTKSQTVRDLSMSEAVTLFTDGLIDEARLVAMLHSLRFTDEAAGELVQLAKIKRVHAATVAAVNRVRSSYVAHRIDRGTANTTIDALGVDADTRDHLMVLWDEERATNRRLLTEAQVHALRKATIIDDAGFLSMHVAMGYTEADAGLLLRLYFPPT